MAVQRKWEINQENNNKTCIKTGSNKLLLAPDQYNFEMVKSTCIKKKKPTTHK